MKHAVWTLFAALAATAHAHEGHGLPGAAHWHASDLWGFMLPLAVLGAAAWWIRRK